MREVPFGPAVPATQATLVSAEACWPRTPCPRSSCWWRRSRGTRWGRSTRGTSSGSSTRTARERRRPGSHEPATALNQNPQIRWNRVRCKGVRSQPEASSACPCDHPLPLPGPLCNRGGSRRHPGKQASRGNSVKLQREQNACAVPSAGSARGRAPDTESALVRTRAPHGTGVSHWLGCPCHSPK